MIEPNKRKAIPRPRPSTREPDGLEDVRDVIAHGGMFYCDEVVSSGDLFTDLSSPKNLVHIMTTKRNAILKRLGYTQMPNPVRVQGKTRRLWTKEPMSNADARTILIEHNEKLSS